MKYISDLNTDGIVKMINDSTVDTYMNITKRDAQGKIKLVYGRKNENGKIICIGEDSIIEVLEKYNLPMYYDEEKGIINIYCNNSICIVAENIGIDRIEDFISKEQRKKEAIIKKNMTLENKTIQEKIFEDNLYISNLLQRGSVYTLEEGSTIFKRIFKNGSSRSLTTIITIIIDNVKIKTTNMALYGDSSLQYAELKNREVKLVVKRGSGMALANLDFCNHINANFLYNQESGQLAITLSDYFTMDLFNVDLEEFVNIINIRDTMKKEEEYSQLKEPQQYLPS